MRIKRVEIIGFKSFCDRAVIQIDASVTGVVGPNGCGKSNIVDAIRWCMGEQSAKHLRGKAMEDVIFAGSETRGGAPMAEVSLTFEDVGFSHQTLELAKTSDESEAERLADAIQDEEEAPPVVAGEVEREVEEFLADRPPEIDFARYTEVTITRRLYRDGTSQYFINKTPCRLRDITDFFLGTGAGTKAYAIIEQGRIGQIVSSRPVDRRAIIEEAAGITKFKAKKKAAEKKLEQTRQNLMRVSDIVGELDKRMGTLRRQAQKAERYRKYKTEWRDIELWKASHRWLELRSEGTLVGERLDTAREELQDVRAAFDAKDAHVVAERAELAVEERRLVGVQDRVYELDNKLRLGDTKIELERREASDLEVRVAQATTEIDDIAAQRARAAGELAEREAELTAIAAERDGQEAEVATRDAAASEARQMVTNAQGRLDEARAELAQRRTEVATTDAQLEALGRRRDETTRRLDRVMAETEQHQERVRELDREGKKASGVLAQLRQTRLDLGSQNQGFEARRDLLAEDVSRGEAEVETLRTETHRRTSRLASLQEIHERYEGFARGTRAVMQRADDIAGGDSIQGVVADIVRAPEMLEVAVEAALGDRLGGVLVSEPAVGAAAIGFLKQAGGGRSAFVPVGKVEARPVASESLSWQAPVEVDVPADPARRVQVIDAATGEVLALVESRSELRVEKLFERVEAPAAVVADVDASWEAPVATSIAALRVVDVATGALVVELGEAAVRLVDAETGVLVSVDDAMHAFRVIDSSGDALELAALVDSGRLIVGPSVARMSGPLRLVGAATGALVLELGEGAMRLVDADTDELVAIEDAMRAFRVLDASGAKVDIGALVEAGRLVVRARATELAAPTWALDPDASAIRVVDAATGDVISDAVGAGSIRVVDAATGEPATDAIGASAIRVVDAATGERVTEMSGANAVHVIDAATGEVLAEIDGPYAIRVIDASSDEAGDDAGHDVGAPIRVIDAASGEVLGASVADAIRVVDAATGESLVDGPANVDVNVIGNVPVDVSGPTVDAPRATRALRAIAVIDADSGEPLAIEDVPAVAESEAFFAAPADGAVGARRPRVVVILDAETGKRLDTPVHVTDAATGEALDAELRAVEALADVNVTDQVRVIDAASGEILTGAPAKVVDPASGRVLTHVELAERGVRVVDATPMPPVHRVIDSVTGNVLCEVIAREVRLVDMPAEPVARKPAFEFEDRTALVAAHRAVGAEGVLGRMADLVPFADGYEAVGKRLLGGTVVVDRLERAIALQERGVADRLITLEGDVVDSDGVVAGGSRDAQGAGVLAQKREIRELEEIVGKLEHELSEKMARLVTAKAELKQVGKAIEGLKSQVHEGDLAIMGHEKDESRVRGDLERHRDRLGHLGTEQLELEDRLRAIALDDEAARSRRSFAADRIDQLERAQLDLVSDVSIHRERLEQLAAVLTEARIRAAQLGEKRAAAEAATLRLHQADADLAARSERLRHEIDDATRRIADLRAACETLAHELEDVRSARIEAQGELETGRAAYQERMAQLTDVELAARELRSRADELSREVGQLELRHGQIGMTRQVVEDSLSERFQIELDGLGALLADYHTRRLVSDVEEDRLTELRELIERMGTDINLTAIDEFAEVSQRFEFLSAQKGDLERAVDQLQRAIDKINKTSRRLFKDTFAAVNATFKEVFPRLFRGGQAHLSLSTSEKAGPDGAPPKEVDLLEAGVEIFAQPPGKKNSTVDQLSGGEKALTAVALVFSIFLIKPSPFCILDEVDAPLDEANVDRYNELVREMTDRSQFIVITHNKRTMESADNLYGVTMQEPGVSKLVSVNLRTLGQPANRASGAKSSPVAV